MELVHCTTDDHLRLDGLWYDSAQGGCETTVVMHHGVTGSCVTPGFFQDSVEPLVQRGLAVLRANSRGHNVVARASPPAIGYIGSAFEKMDDCHHDWDAWCRFASSRGAKRIVLWGHSLGAVKSILVGAAGVPDGVSAIVASSPPRFSFAQFARCEEEWDEFKASFDEALQATTSGAADRLIEVAKPTPLLIQAERYVEKYGPDETYDYVRHVPKVDVPLLITIGGKEGIERRPGLSRLAFWEAANYLPELAEKHANVRFESIADGDHAYTGVGDALRAVVFTFLKEERILN